MRTNKNKKLLVVAVGLVCSAVLVWFCTSLQGSQKTYEIHPPISPPEYRTDAARAIDAYERLMERYMELTGGSLLGIGADVKAIGEKLDSINTRLIELSVRMERIEKALAIRGLKKTKPGTACKSDPNQTPSACRPPYVQP